MSRSMAATAAGLALLIPTAAGAADAPAFCAGAAQAVIDNQLIAETMLDAGGVTRAFARRLEQTKPELRRGLTTAQAIVEFNIALCNIAPDTTKMECSDVEKTQLVAAGVAMDGLLNDAAHVDVSGPSNHALFFRRGGQLRCKPPTELAAKRPKLPDEDKDKFWDIKNLRVRGNGTDLVFSRNSAAFADVEKAILSFSDNNEKDTTSTKLVAAIGYSIPFDQVMWAEDKRRLVYGVIPYFAVNVDTSREGAKPRKVESNQVEVGATLQFKLDLSTKKVPSGYLTHVLAVTPRYVVNYEDDSAFIAVNTLYRPIVLLGSGFGFNRVQNITGTKLRWSFVFDLRLNTAHFVRTGSRIGADADDIIRLGGRTGLSITSGAKDLPIEFTITDTWMPSLTGSRKDLNLYKADVSVYFHNDKYFGVEFAYAHGRDSDFEDNDDTWTIGFAVKY